MVFRLDAEVLEDRVRPEAFHGIPVLDLTMANGVVDAITRSAGSSESLISDEEIQVLRTTLRRQVRARPTTSPQERRLVGNRGSSRASRASGARLGCNCGREDERGRVVTSETLPPVSLRRQMRGGGSRCKTGDWGLNSPSLE